MNSITESMLNGECSCGNWPIDQPNDDCERCELVIEILRLRDKVAELEKRAVFYRTQWESAMRVIHAKNPNHDRDAECIPPSEMARRHVEAMTLVWEHEAEGGEPK